jgi:hypothetical protein
MKMGTMKSAGDNAVSRTMLLMAFDFLRILFRLCKYIGSLFYTQSLGCRQACNSSSSGEPGTG